MQLDEKETQRIAALVLASVAIVIFSVVRAYWPEDQATIPEPELDREWTPAEAYVLGEPLDLNAATPDELELLPGVGSKLARRIHARLPLEELADLEAIVGSKLYEKLEREVVIRAATSRSAPPASPAR